MNNERGIYGNRVGTLTDLWVVYNRVTNNSWGGMVLFNSQNGHIGANLFCQNGMYGISLSNSLFNTISINSFTSDTNGIVFYSPSDSNWTYYNSFCYNYNGILVYSGVGNTVQDSNFIENKNLQAWDGDRNYWEINFWSGHGCSTPFILNPSTGVKDNDPLCRPTRSAPRCDCGVDGP